MALYLQGNRLDGAIRKLEQFLLGFLDGTASSYFKKA